MVAFALKRRRDYVSRVSAGLGARAAPRNIWAAAATSQRMDRHERTNSAFALPKSCVNRPFTSQSPKRREKQRRFNVPNRDARSLASPSWIVSSKSACNLCPFLFRFRSIFAPFNYTITFVPNYTPLLYPTIRPLPTHFSPWAPPLSQKRSLAVRFEEGAKSGAATAVIVSFPKHLRDILRGGN